MNNTVKSASPWDRKEMPAGQQQCCAGRLQPLHYAIAGCWRPPALERPADSLLSWAALPGEPGSGPGDGWFPIWRQGLPLMV